MKNIALPAILYGTNIIDMPENFIDELQRIEKYTPRKTLGASKYASSCTLKVGYFLYKKKKNNKWKIQLYYEYVKEI